ncbi:MAG: M1 family metallopeptidase [Clostridia bacterium]|nr:M1 family metallopeptidase [Clostridia bacterium]
MKRKFSLFARFALSLVCALTFVLGAFAFTGCSTPKKGNEYEVTATFHEGDMSVELDMQVTFRNETEGELDHVCFNVFANAYRKGAAYSPVSAQKTAAAYPNGVSYGGFSVEKTEVDGKESTYLLSGVDETLLTVRIPSLKKGKTRTVRIVGKVMLANVNHRLGYGDKTVNLGNFLPTLCVYEKGGFYECPYYDRGDPFYSEIANYSVRFTAPSDYVVASGGRLVSTKPQGENVTYAYTLKNARDFALVLSKEFEVLSAKENGVEISYYHLGDSEANRHLTVAKQSLEHYEKTIGKYPYSHLTVAQADFIEGGMEYPALTYVSSFAPREEVPRIIAHEAAHQWWYGAVGVNQVEEGFLDESLAEYTTLTFLDAHPEYGLCRKDLVNAATTAYGLYCDVYSQLVRQTDTSMRRPLNEFLSEYEYVNLAYNKGLLMWENYRVSVGDARFFQTLSTFYKQNYLKTATTESLYAVARKTAGGEGLLRSFIEGTAVI